MSLALPEGFDGWSLEEKNAFIRSLKYNWDYWARPEQKLPDLKDPWKVWMILSGRGWGKLAHVEWPVYSRKVTQSGYDDPAFTTMGDLRLGDMVYAPDGTETMVVGAYDTEECDEYLIKFSDGSEVSVSDTHEWVTWTHRDRKQYSRYGNLGEYPDEWWDYVGDLKHSKGGVVGSFGPEVRTTAQILNTLRVGTRGDTNHSIPLTKPLEHPDIETFVDPYLLGLWLGDGSSSGAEITQHPDDMAHLEPHIVAAGYSVTPYATGTGQAFGIGPGFRTALRAEGVLDNKHIPERYLRASVAQRIALVQGLMDTDGGPVGYTRDRQCSTVEFCTTIDHVADMMMKILWSLGQKPTVSKSKAGYRLPDGQYKRCEDRYRIKFRTTFQVFRLPRKADVIVLNGAQSKRSHARMVVDVVKTGRKVPMRCIRVAHKSAIFLIGHELIPTHNTRTGAEAIKKLMLDNPGCRIGIIGMTAGAVRDTCYEGESGLLSVLPPDTYDRQNGGKYNRSLGQLTLSNGSMAFSFSGSDPEKLRGFQSNFLWMDELCAFSYSQEAWDMAMMGLRLGAHPRIIITTTPKPSPLIVELVRRGNVEPDNVILTSGSTFDNAANLPESTLQELRNRYEGTTMGRQELYAELILDDPGALWNRALIEESRVSVHDFDLTKMARIVVAIDPSMSALTERESETGMIVAGLGTNGHAYVIEDCSALRPSPDMWANLAISKYHQYAANRIVAEVNQGYDLVSNLLSTKDDRVPIKKVYATRGGKFLRAEPVHALYEQKRVHHVGLHGKLEDQMTQWVPGKASPDRLDAMVWAITDLMLGGGIAELFNPNSLGKLPGILKAR